MPKRPPDPRARRALGSRALVSAASTLLLVAGAQAQPGAVPLSLGDAEEPERDRDDGEETAFDTGGEAGYARLDSINYLAPTLAGDLRLDFFQAAIRLPLRFDPDRGEIRDKDWDEVGDYFRVGQCVRMDWSSQGIFEREHGMCLPWDVERDDYYFSLRMGPVYDYDLGHGTILRSYSNNLDPDHFRAGVIGDLNFHQFVRADFLIDNVTRPQVIGGTFSLRPFSYEVAETRQIYEYRHNFQLSTTAVSDLGAPTEVRTAFGEALTDDAGNLLYRSEPVTVVGADLRYRFVFGRQVEFEARADWNWITGHGMGGHGQVWWIYNHPDGDYSVRGIGELRYVQQDYIPNYFDSYYFIQRQQYGMSSGARAQLEAVLPGADDPFLTKQELLGALPEDGWNAGYLGGVSFEAYRGEGEERRSAFRARLFVSDNFERESDGQFLLTVQVPRLTDKIDIYALYSRQNFEDFGDLFSLDDTLVKLLVRWDLNEQFYVLMNYGRIWQLAEDGGTSAEGFSSNNEFGLSLGFAEELIAGGGDE